MKFRFISPFNNSPTSKMGRLLGKILEPIQNSGMRLDSITNIIKSTHQNIQNHPVQPNEKFVSFDAVSMYDFLTTKLAMYCIGIRKEALGGDRMINLDTLRKCLECCYEEGIEYRGKMYQQISGAPTGHPISSAIQNVIMSTYETEIYSKYEAENKIRQYHRWVDDTLVRLDDGVETEILQKLNNFDPDGLLKFTVDQPAVDSDGYKFLNFLDFTLSWREPNNVPNFKTTVFRKATAAKTMKPFQDYGPKAWKTGTLVWFLRRAVTHSSTPLLMHQEFQYLEEKFAEAGFPRSLISKKINQTVEVMMGYSKKKNEEDEKLVSNRWLVLHVPWCGEDADKELFKIRRLLPIDVCRISIAYTTQKFRQLLPTFRPKPDQNNDDQPINRKLLQNNLVYKYKCECGKEYIGETKRRLSIRVAEHKKKSSPMSEHLKDCKSEFHEKYFTIMARGLKGMNARKKYETIMIKWYSKQGKLMNICEVSRNPTLF